MWVHMGEAGAHKVLVAGFDDRNGCRIVAPVVPMPPLPVLCSLVPDHAGALGGAGEALVLCELLPFGEGLGLGDGLPPG